MGQHFHSQFELAPTAHSLISIAARVSQPGKVMAVTFCKHLPNTAVKCVTLRISQMIHFGRLLLDSAHNYTWL